MKNLKNKLALSLLTFSMLATAVGCGAEPAPAPEETEAPVVESAAPETVTLMNGELPIPEKFDNFIALGNTQLDHLVALDVLPVAASMPRTPDDPDAPNSEAYYNDGFGAMYPDGMLDGVESLNMQLDASIERIIELAPDFILASESDEKHLD